MKAMNSMMYVVLVLLSCGICSGADGVYSPVANLTEKWTNDAQWVTSGEGISLVISQSLAKSYLPSNTEWPQSQVGSVKATSISSSGRFVGDYSNSAITHVSFDVMRNGVEKIANLRFNCANGHSWAYEFELPEQHGVWERREIPMTYSSQWTGSVANAVVFDEDRTKITSIKVQSTTLNGPAKLLVDNFKVVGPWEKGPPVDGIEGEIPLAWLMENSSPNLLVAAGQGGLDADGDGFSNYAEYIAGTGPNDANENFKIEIGQDADGKPVVTWKHTDYRNYKVFKSSDLTVNGSFIEETGSIQTIGAKNQIPVSEGAAGAAFYRVEVDKQ